MWLLWSGNVFVVVCYVVWRGKMAGLTLQMHATTPGSPKFNNKTAVLIFFFVIHTRENAQNYAAIVLREHDKNERFVLSMFDEVFSEFDLASSTSLAVRFATN